jgi:hypothetical protein
LQVEKDGMRPGMNRQQYFQEMFADYHRPHRMFILVEMAREKNPIPLIITSNCR